jgi:hypothetical protein
MRVESVGVDKARIAFAIECIPRVSVFPATCSCHISISPCASEVPEPSLLCGR